MDDEKALGTAAEEAAEAEEEARRGDDAGTYTHTFLKPFSYRGSTIEELTFDWGRLSGDDHLEIEDELLRRGKTLVTPEFTSDFLWGMAVRACTLRDDNGVPALGRDAVRAMGMRDFQLICRKARSFLLRAGS